MNQYLKVHFEIQRDDRTYVFELPAGCPTGEAYDVVHEMLQKIVERSLKPMPIRRQLLKSVTPPSSVPTTGWRLRRSICLDKIMRLGLSRSRFEL